MFNRSSHKRDPFNELGSAVFRDKIAPKIADHIQNPIRVGITGENARLNAWLLDNLSTILPFRIRLTDTRLQRPAAARKQKGAGYE